MDSFGSTAVRGALSPSGPVQVLQVCSIASEPLFDSSADLQVSTVCKINGRVNKVAASEVSDMLFQCPRHILEQLEKVFALQQEAKLRLLDCSTRPPKHSEAWVDWWTVTPKVGRFLVWLCVVLMACQSQQFSFMRGKGFQNYDRSVQILFNLRSCIILKKLH